MEIPDVLKKYYNTLKLIESHFRIETRVPKRIIDNSTIPREEFIEKVIKGELINKFSEGVIKSYLTEVKETSHPYGYIQKDPNDPIHGDSTTFELELMVMPPKNLKLIVEAIICEIPDEKIQEIKKRNQIYPT